MTKTFLGRLILAGVGTVCALAAAELVLRARPPSGRAALVRFSPLIDAERAKFCEYSPALGWKGKRNVAAFFDGIDCRCYVAQNGDGHRGRSLSTARPGRAVHLLGDSYAWGYGVNEGDLVSARIEEATGGAIDVVNFGVSGYGTDQELMAWTADGAPHHPVAVVLLFCLANDLWDISNVKRYGYFKPMFKLRNGRLFLTHVPVPPHLPNERATRPSPFITGQVRRLAAKSALAAELLGQVARVPALRKKALAWGWIPDVDTNGFEPLSLYNSASHELTPAWDLADHLLRELDRDVRQAGGRLFVGAVPTLSQIDPETWRSRLAEIPASDRAALDPDAPSRRLRETCAAAGIGYIDLPAAFRSAGRPDALFFPINQHWTAAGHAAAARAIAAALRSAGVWSDRPRP